LPPSIAVAANERVLKNLAAHSHRSSRTTTAEEPSVIIPDT
jgi:hypothetical protein